MFEQAFQRLRDWSKTLTNHLGSTQQETREILDGKVKLPEGCPSRSSAAAMVLRTLQQDRDEINAAIDDLEKAIWDEGG